MGEPFVGIVARRIGRFAGATASQISAINKKYATPHIEITPAVRAALLFLRLYLIALVGLLVYKFVTLVR